MIRTKCPKCGCEEYTKQGREKTKFKGIDIPVLQERRKCKNCGCKYTVKPKNRNYPKCPFCGQSHTRKAGFSKFGAQLYKCTSCNRTFQDLATRCHSEQISINFEPISESQKLTIESYYSNGFSVPYIQKFVKVDQKQINEVVKDLTITPSRPSGLERAIYCFIQGNRNGVFHHTIAENFCISDKKLTGHIRFLINDCNYRISYTNRRGYKIH